VGLKEEILEQPHVLQRWLETQLQETLSIARIIRQREVEYVFLAARGTSDHAGVYAQYLWGSLNRLPVALVAPSLFTFADPYSAADFQHGPIAIIERGFPVLAIAPRGAALADLLTLLRRLRDGQEAELLVLSDSDEALALGHSAMRLPAAVPEWLTPLVSIIPAQLYSYHLTRAKGYDPETPRGLRKVTLTR